MRKPLTFAGFGLGATLALTTAALANDPLLGGTPGKVVGDKELASVKGSGPDAQYYGYLGQTYLNYASLYGGLGQYYNYLGYSGAGNYGTNYYYDAYYYSSYASSYYYDAYYYSYHNQ
jgi:hypothetical protein